MPKPSICRAVVVFWSEAQYRPRPGHIVAVSGSNPDLVDVNIQLHGVTDCAALAAVRSSPFGNTLCGAVVHDACTEEERAQLIASGVSCWCEWPSKV